MSDSYSDVEIELVDVNGALIDYNKDPINALNSEGFDEKDLDDEDFGSERFRYVDHFFDIDSSSLKIKSNEDDEWKTVEEVKSNQVPYKFVEDYFKSINHNQVAFDFFDKNNINTSDIEKFVEIDRKVFFLINVNGEKHIINSEIAPISFRNFFYESRIKKDHANQG